VPNDGTYSLLLHNVNAGPDSVLDSNDPSFGQLEFASNVVAPEPASLVLLSARGCLGLTWCSSASAAERLLGPPANVQSGDDRQFPVIMARCHRLCSENRSIPPATE
jgi:hypothetical protein